MIDTVIVSATGRDVSHLQTPHVILCPAISPSKNPFCDLLCPAHQPVSPSDAGLLCPDVTPPPHLMQGFWLVGVLLGWALAFKAGMGIRGLWIGIASGDSTAGERQVFST